MAASPLAHVSLEVPGTSERLGELHAAVERFWEEVDRVVSRPPHDEWRLVFSTALAEVASNVVRHAYRDGAVAGALHTELLAFGDRIEARFTDWGLAFDGDLSASSAPPNAVLDPDELPESGYGLSVIRAAVDELHYERTPASPSSPHGENRWRLLKRLPPNATSAS